MLLRYAYACVTLLDCFHGVLSKTPGNEAANHNAKPATSSLLYLTIDRNKARGKEKDHRIG